MKLFLRSTTIAALSLCCIQIVDAELQPVVAKKKKLTDIKTVTVTITDKNSTYKSQSTFRKNSNPPAQPLTFDFSKGDNIITVDYKDSSSPITKSVKKKKTPEGSEIIFDDKSIKIDTTKAKKTPKTEVSRQVPVPENVPTNIAPRATASPSPAPGQQSSPALSQQQDAKTIKALVRPPARTSWNVVSGSTSLTSDVAETRIENPRSASSDSSVLDAGLYDAVSRKQLSIYQDRDTNIYAKKYGAGTGQMTTLSKEAIHQAGKKPYLKLDKDGNATVVDGNLASS